jgi:hypothetical protein
MIVESVSARFGLTQPERKSTDAERTKSFVTVWPTTRWSTPGTARGPVSSDRHSRRGTSSPATICRATPSSSCRVEPERTSGPAASECPDMPMLVCSSRVRLPLARGNHGADFTHTRVQGLLRMVQGDEALRHACQSDDRLSPTRRKQRTVTVSPARTQPTTLPDIGASSTGRASPGGEHQAHGVVA